MPEPSGFYYPNRIARGIFVAMEDVMGRHGLSALLHSAQMDEYINQPPPDNLVKQFDFANLSAMNEALEEIYGARGGLGFALRIGRASFSKGLKSFGAMRGINDPAFRALPLNMQIEISLRGLASVFTNFTDQETEIETVDDGYLIHVENSPFAWARQSDKPVCHALAGIFLESLSYATDGYLFFVREVECRACGADECIFKVNQKAIGGN